MLRATDKDMLMMRTMTVSTKRNAIVHFVPEFEVGGKGLDMVGMQDNSLAVATAKAALLASVIVASIYSGAPILVFGLATREVVLMRLVNVARPSCLVRLLALRCGGWVRSLGATLRAVLSQHATLAVLRHGVIAHGAGDGHGKAIGAKLIELVDGLVSLTAHLARFADAPCVGLESGGTGNASRVLDGLAQLGNCGREGLAFGAWSKGISIARFAHSVVSTIDSALHATVLCHASIIPYLNEYGKLNALQRWADATGKTPVLIA